jgi:beta-fructofuranosidase
MFALADRVLWDFWTIDVAGTTWLDALSAPRDPVPDTRHNRARVDVLTSTDLTDWTWRGIALEPARPGAWDDLAIWTGSVAADPAGGYVMLYTGRGRADGGKAQRIGLARSADLVRWDRHPAPVIEADPSLYRMQGRNGSTNWRDPWLERDPASGLWRAWITAQHPDGPVEESGTIALAESLDLLHWTVHPPVVAERLCEHMEVPQLLEGGDLMLVNTYAHHVPDGGALPRACMSLLFGKKGDGRFHLKRIVEQWPSDSRYIVKMVRPGIGLCWMGRQPDGRFLGQISDPFPLDLKRASDT